MIAMPGGYGSPTEAYAIAGQNFDGDISQAA